MAEQVNEVRARDYEDFVNMSAIRREVHAAELSSSGNKRTLDGYLNASQANFGFDNDDRFGMGRTFPENDDDESNKVNEILDGLGFQYGNVGDDTIKLPIIFRVTQSVAVHGMCKLGRYDFKWSDGYRALSSITAALTDEMGLFGAPWGQVNVGRRAVPARREFRQRQALWDEGLISQYGAERVIFDEGDELFFKPAVSIGWSVVEVERPEAIHPDVLGIDRPHYFVNMQCPIIPRSKGPITTAVIVPLFHEAFVTDYNQWQWRDIMAIAGVSARERQGMEKFWHNRAPGGPGNGRNGRLPGRPQLWEFFGGRIETKDRLDNPGERPWFKNFDDDGDWEELSELDAPNAYAHGQAFTNYTQGAETIMATAVREFYEEFSPNALNRDMDIKQIRLFESLFKVLCCAVWQNVCYIYIDFTAVLDAYLADDDENWYGLNDIFVPNDEVEDWVPIPVNDLDESMSSRGVGALVALRTFFSSVDPVGIERGQPPAPEALTFHSHDNRFLRDMMNYEAYDLGVENYELVEEPTLDVYMRHLEMNAELDEE
jgi:8-oxo-dGTP pyrophosphatase MutT (NUDIX family)